MKDSTAYGGLIVSGDYDLFPEIVEYMKKAEASVTKCYEILIVGSSMSYLYSRYLHKLRIEFQCTQHGSLLHTIGNNKIVLKSIGKNGCCKALDGLRPQAIFIDYYQLRIDDRSLEVLYHLCRHW